MCGFGVVFTLTFRRKKRAFHRKFMIFHCYNVVSVMIILLHCSNEVFIMKLPDLNKSEYEILKVIWKHENSSVREVHDQVKLSTRWAYTTTKTHMDRMIKRGLLQRSQSNNVFVYQSLVSKPEGIAKMVQYFADRVLEVNYSSVITMFSKSEALTDEEIKKLNSILEKKDD